MSGKDHQNKVPLSIRATSEFKTQVKNAAKDGGISQAEFLQALLDIHLGKRTRRPGKQNFAQSTKLANFHKEIIAFGNLIRSELSDHPHYLAIVDRLVKLTTAALDLDSSGRRK
ncbi:hypothetical protein [Bradyrhizobium guangzhouense]|uniref:Uncharacterized protein n=1 Tax=Bradyrhizobium guangzhouense TaxID=1325095 RepID=A0AAE5WWK7_9BRAD|nr:hypothetical protein [Bradyrhizobium guangzhouense]QAU44434.1 hypothetical protein XH91_03070 [Bradyrhizobium guangzhouense]RXH07281.1 hypothetical protein EAS54_38065 [Bradyrhizobium guangzhouense]RXH09997.1 hypothetical protein EAS56_23910 [Bradyrhizobium guangzhouense]